MFFFGTHLGYVGILVHLYAIMIIIYNYDLGIILVLKYVLRIPKSE